MGILHDVAARIRALFNHPFHVDPEAEARKIYAEFMDEAAKLVHGLEDRVIAIEVRVGIRPKAAIPPVAAPPVPPSRASGKDAPGPAAAARVNKE